MKGPQPRLRAPTSRKLMGVSRGGVGGHHTPALLLGQNRGPQGQARGLRENTSFHLKSTPPHPPLPPPNPMLVNVKLYSVESPVSVKGPLVDRWGSLNATTTFRKMFSFHFISPI